MFSKRGFLTMVAAMFIVSGFFVCSNGALAATVTLYPDGIGNFDQWSLGAGATKIIAVGSGDITDASYISETADGDSQTFTIPGASLLAGATINSVTINAVARESSGTSTIQLRLEKGTGGSDISDGLPYDLTGSYATYSQVFTINPFTGLAWALSEVNSWTTKFGVLYSDSGSGNTGRITQIYVVVDYTPDTIPPVIASHGNEIVTADTFGSAVVSYVLPIATDNIDPIVTVACLPAPSSVFPIGATTVTCNAIDSSGNHAIPTTFTVTVNPGAVSASQSTFIFDNSGQISTNGGTANFTITAKDQYGNIIPGVSVVVASTGSNNTFVPPNPGITNLSGWAQMGLQSTKAEAKIVSVTVGGVLLATTIPVSFIPGSPANGTISASTITPEADLAGTTVTLTINVTDGSSNPVPDNTAVALLASAGGIIGGSGNTVGGVVTRILTFVGKGSVTLSFSGLVALGDTVINFIDTTAPVITILPPNPAEVEYRGVYTDNGATAWDNIDGDITGSISTVNSVDPNTTNVVPDPISKLVGIYTVTYDVSDASANPAVQGVRTVNVYDRTAPILNALTSDATAGTLMKIGDTIKFILTPAVAEPVATVVGSYNGQVLSWSTADAGATYSATYTVTAGDPDQNSVTLQITGVIMTDEAGNPSLPIDGTDVANLIDANVPTVASVDSDGDVYNLSTISPHLIKITFNEYISNTPIVAVSGLGQTVNDCADADVKTFCFDYNVPSATDSTVMTIQLSGALDLAGNVMADDNTHAFIVDTIAPDAPTVDVPDYINTGNQSSVPLAVSGEVGATINGTIIDSIGTEVAGTLPVNVDSDSDGLNDSLIVNLDLFGLADGGITVSATVTDAAGNTGPAGSDTATKETTKPAIILSTTAPDFTSISPIPVVATFSEDVIGFPVNFMDYIVVANGTAGNFVPVSGSIYTFDITPAGDGEVTVNVLANIATDAAGNSNIASNQLSRVYDTTKPTAVVTLKEGASPSDGIVKAGDILTVNVEFSEDITEYSVPTIAISGANSLPLTSMTRVDATHYTYDHVVTGPGDGDAGITIAAGEDLAGNVMDPNSGTTFTVDNILPVIDQHGDIIDTANATGGKIIDYAVTANDSHDGPLTPICTPSSGSFFPVSGTTIATCNATDAAGNAAEPMTFTVTINPDVITHIVLTASPIELAFSDTSLITVTGKDQYENIVTNNNSTVIVLSADGGGSLADTILTLSAGVATTNLSKDSTGLVHVTASSEGLAPKEVTVTFTEVDISSPYVESHTPANGAEDVALNIRPVLLFSEPLDTTTVNSANIQLRKYSDNSPVAATVSPAEGDRQVIITPTNPLDFSVQYYLAVSSGVTDKVGNSAIVLDQATKDSHQFTTVADNTVLAVTQVALEKMSAIADNTFDNGWRWRLSVTAPINETKLQMKFTDFIGTSTSTIPASDNIRFSSPQSADPAVLFSSSSLDGSGFSFPLILNGDMDSSAMGRQFQIIVEVKVPVGTAGGSYSDSYDIKTTNPI